MRDSNDGGWGASRVARDVISGCNGSLDLLGVQWMKLLKNPALGMMIPVILSLIFVPFSRNVQ